MDTKKFYRRVILIFGGGIILALVVFMGIIPAVQGAGRPAYLDISVLPAGAKVDIEGQKYRNAVYEMEPGAYIAQVTLGDLAPEVVTMNLERGRTTGMYMNWSENGGWRYYTADELAHKNSLSEVVPIYASMCGEPASRMNCDAIVVQYDRVSECGNEECLVINGRGAKLTDEILSLVREKLAEKGYNLDDYQYIYVQNDNR